MQNPVEGVVVGEVAAVHVAVAEEVVDRHVEDVEGRPS